MNPLVIAYHLIWTGYGHWLLNDLRNSHSQIVHSDILKELGDLHLGRKKVQPHVHILIRKHKHTVEEMSRRLHEESRVVFQQAYPSRPIRTSGCGWKVFLEDPQEVGRTIRHIDDNPTKIGLPEQDWSIVTQPYDNWPLHPGHKLNRPWARRLHVR